MLAELDDMGSSDVTQANKNEMIKELEDRSLPYALPLNASQKERAIEGAALRMLKKFGHKEVVNKKPGHYLGTDHPKMKALRDFINNLETTHFIHPRLIGNFDQVSIVCNVT